MDRKAFCSMVCDSNQTNDCGHSSIYTAIRFLLSFWVSLLLYLIGPNWWWFLLRNRIWGFSEPLHVSNSPLKDKALLAAPSDQNYGRLGIFFLFKTHIRLAKLKCFLVQFCLFSPRFLQILTNFQIKFSITCSWIEIYTFKRQLSMHFSVLQLWQANQSTCDQVRTWFGKLSLRSTIFKTQPDPITLGWWEKLTSSPKTEM